MRPHPIVAIIKVAMACHCRQNRVTLEDERVSFLTLVTFDYHLTRAAGQDVEIHSSNLRIGG